MYKLPKYLSNVLDAIDLEVDILPILVYSSYDEVGTKLKSTYSKVIPGGIIVDLFEFPTFSQYFNIVRSPSLILAGRTKYGYKVKVEDHVPFIYKELEKPKYQGLVMTQEDL